MILNMTGGAGSGAGLNFKVVGGTSAPSNPAENTIWVNTDTEITSWVFSATVPENPEEGMVHVATSSSAVAEFNAVKKNSIQVYPNSCTQYIGGAWVNKDAETYQNGEWLPWMLYLYENGTFNDIAGDIAKRGAKSTLSSDKAEGKATVSKNATSITIIASSLSGTQVYFTNKIDLTPYSTLYFEGSSYKSPSYNYGLFMGVWSSLGSAYNTGLVASNSAITSNCAIDVSELSGEYYIGFFICDATDAGGITVNKVYLK